MAGKLASFEEYRGYNAMGLAQLVRKGDVSAAELLDLALARSAEVNPKINAIDGGSLYLALGVSSNLVVAKKVSGREQQLGRKVRDDELESITWQGLQAGLKISGVADSEARDSLHKASRVMGMSMQDYDLVLSPKMAIVPQTLGLLSLRQDYQDFMMVAAAASSFTSLYNMTGQPAMSVLLHWTPSGVPVGMMFAARTGDEATLFRLAAQLEQQVSWFKHTAAL